MTITIKNIKWDKNNESLPEECSISLSILGWKSMNMNLKLNQFF